MCPVPDPSSVFSVHLLDKGNTRSEDDEFSCLLHGKQTTFHVEPLPFGNKAHSVHEYRVFLPREFKQPTDAVNRQWRILVAKHMANYLTSLEAPDHLLGKVDVSDLETFDGHHPKAIFW